jgi:hypothetical protein
MKTKTKTNDLYGSIFYRKDYGYMFCSVRELDCLSALVYDSVELLITDLGLFLKRGHWAYMESGRSSKALMDEYNGCDNDTFMRLGDQILVALHLEVIVHPSLIPTEDRGIWINYLMSIDRLSYTRPIV